MNVIAFFYIERLLLNGIRRQEKIAGLLRVNQLVYSTLQIMRSVRLLNHLANGVIQP